ncbi:MULTISPECIES: glycosyltransferase family 4 protein [unclassified Chryseobacterium]|uniref:glycosyltransferase family 4 protein n=1 Tax=unclassified Chryseobacterium TaxID=2593645 RepID=UPI000D344F79|nr:MULTISPECIES: glycosyltransferase family 4 protein [unclassified Chryseobacterium]PTT71825.1 glycosyltransferase WbuB [Chryseobacterium sp. HMWF001]PVV59720.1 glycosyltransferase WbuB [Chryseobacterium sp. HMWF035]
MKNLWIATELFYPEETSTSFILTKIANRLSEKYHVKVVCGDPVYDKQKKSSHFSLDSRVNVHRIKGWGGNKNSLLSRSLRFVFLSLSIFFYLWKNVKKGEKVFMVTNPAPLILLLSILKRFKKIELIILVHDVFPENTIPAGIIKSEKSVLYRVLRSIFDKAYSKADLLITLGRDMQKVIEAKIRKYNRRSKIEIIENWGDTEGIYPLLKEGVFNEDSSLKDRIIFQYAGNLGRVQGLIELLHIIKKVKNDRLAFHFVGEGAVRDTMIEYVKENQLTNVFFDGAYSREEQLQVLNKADVSFVSLAPKMFGLGVPSKTYNILAAGKPVLYVGEKNSEIDLLLRDENIGYSFQHFEEQKILDFFNSFDETSVKELELMKENARKVAEEKFSEEIILNKFYNII